MPAMEAARGTPVIDAGRLLDEGRWTACQQRLVFLTALAIVLDGADNQLPGTVVPALAFIRRHIPRRRS